MRVVIDTFGDASVYSGAKFAGCVMVARKILALVVGVQILPGELVQGVAGDCSPFYLPLWLHFRVAIHLSL